MYYLVNVKWGKQTFKEVELDTGSDVESFKVVLMSLSNVLPENQKLMIKGKIVKDGDDLTKFPLKDGLTLMMMGTAEEQQLKEPEKPIKFLEDMTPAERA